MVDRQHQSAGTGTHVSNQSSQVKFRRQIFRAMSVAFGLVLLGLAIRDVDFATLSKVLSQVSPGWLVLALATVLATIAIKGWRWAILLKPVAPQMGFQDVVGILLVGQAANILLPLRSGDLIRSGLASRDDAGRLPAVVTGLVIEKGLDALMLVSAMALAVPMLPKEAPLNTGLNGLVVLALGALGVALLTLVFSRRAWVFIRDRLGLLPSRVARGAVDMGDRFVAGLEQLRRAGGFGLVILLTLVSWVAMYATNMAILYSLGLSVPPQAGLLVMVLVFIAIIPRLMPGQVGPFYFFARLALEQFGVDPATSTAYAVLLHAFFVLPPLVGAGIYLLTSRNRTVLESARSP